MRLLTILLGTLCQLALVGCASSQSGVVLKTDRWQQTVRIGDELYAVTGQTELFGPQGQPIRLHQVPSVSDPNIGVRRAAWAEVDFQAWERGGRWYLDRLWVRPR
jgi:hypothetical protein